MKPASCIVKVCQYGDPTAPVLLFVHGFGASSSWWDACVQGLQAGYALYMLDLTFRRPVASMAQDIVAWMDLQGIERLALIGHSLGAHIALEIAACYPERITHLLLINPAMPQNEVSIRQWILRCREARRRSTNPPAKEAWSVRYTQFHPRTWRPVLRALRQPMRAIAGDRTLILWGTRDPLFPPCYATRFLEQMPCAQLVFINAGHCIMCEQSDELLQWVQHFVERTEA